MHKVNILTTSRRTTTITTTKKKTTHKTSTIPVQAQKNPPTIGIILTLCKTPTIQVQTQKKTPLTGQKPSLGYVVIPYTQAEAESYKKICGKYGIQTYFNGNTTIK